MTGERAGRDRPDAEHGGRAPARDTKAGVPVGPLDQVDRVASVQTSQSLSWLQRTAGNRAVTGVMSPSRSPSVQRDGEGQPPPHPSDVNPSQLRCPSTFQVPVATPPAIDIPSQLGAGDLAPSGPPSDQANVMAMRDDMPLGVVQRDDSPHPSGDVSQQTTVPIVQSSPAVPVSVSATLIYRNINAWSSGKVDFGHEPSVQFSVDAKGAGTVQSAVTLMNTHWTGFFTKELEVGLSGYIQTQLWPAMSSSFGGQLQGEQHLNPWFSVTLSGNGMYTAPRGAQNGTLSVTGSLGVLVHLDGIKWF